MDAMQAHFRPEFLNRIDEIIIFRNLTLDDIKQIVDIQLRGLTRRMAERGIELELTDQAKALLAHRGFDPVYGARPLKRALQKEIIDALALRILGGEFVDGDRIVADVEQGEIAFRKAKAASDGERRKTGSAH